MPTLLVRLMLALLLAVPVASAPPEANSFAVRGVRLFDGRRVIARANVVVRGGLVAAAGAGVKIPAGLPVVDGAGRTLLPGLIDAHVHVFPGAQADALRFGVTTELDMFSLRADFPRWKAQRASLGRTREADTWSAGIGVSAPHGHPSGVWPGSEGIRTLASAEAADAFVATSLAEGSDYVKIILEDNSFVTPGRTIPALSPAEVCAAVAAAHRRGKLAIVHVSRLAAARVALDCGADGLAHLWGDAVADPAFLRAARARHLFVVSTLSVLAAAAKDPETTAIYRRPEIASRLSPMQEQLLRAGFPLTPPPGFALALVNARRLHAAGVPILAGVDAPNPGGPHGAGLHAELSLLVRGGLSPVEALAAATWLPARIFRLPGRGCVARGCRADLLLVRGDPSRRIGDTMAIESVWKNGYPVELKAPSS